MNTVLIVTSIKVDVIDVKSGIGLISSQLPRINAFHALAIASRVMMSLRAMNVRQRAICTILKTQVQTDVSAMRKKGGNKYQINFSSVIAQEAS